LHARRTHAYEEAVRRGAEHVLRSFEEAVRQSKAVLCRQLSVANWLVSSDNVLFGTFWLEIEAGIRSPEQNSFDQARGAVDATFFPHYHREIRFAALSIDEQGPLPYGPCSIVLRDSNVAHRSTVFEENSLVFARQFKIIVGNPPPLGYRAVWNDRHKLAVAKLHERIDRATDRGDFAGILLKQAAGTDEVEFVEVHIYGSLNRSAIECVRIPQKEVRSPEAKVIVKSMGRKLAEVGATLVVY